MYLTELHMHSFRNHEHTKHGFCRAINVITGANGVGKTNLLDAVFMLCHGRSFFHATDAQLMMEKSRFYRIEGHFANDQDASGYQISVASEIGKRRQIRWNSTPLSRSALLGKCPAVMITPFDISLMLEGSDARRKLIDESISSVDPNYLKYLTVYNRLLDQKNALLKKAAANQRIDEQLLLSFDEQMQNPALEIFERRKVFITDFSKRVVQLYNELSEETETIELRYQSEMHDKEWSVLQIQARKKDFVLGRSTSGVHKDDLLFFIKDFPLKKYASQGQLKSMLIAVKLAQYQWFKEKLNISPLLLLDDISEKIDEHRSRRLMKQIAKRGFGQIFITDTSEERVKQLLDGVEEEKKFFKFEGD